MVQTPHVTHPRAWTYNVQGRPVGTGQQRINLISILTVKVKWCRWESYWSLMIITALSTVHLRTMCLYMCYENKTDCTWVQCCLPCFDFSYQKWFRSQFWKYVVTSFSSAQRFCRIFPEKYFFSKKMTSQNPNKNTTRNCKSRHQFNFQLQTTG